MKPGRTQNTRLAESKLKPPFIKSHSTEVISTRWIRELLENYLGAQGTFNHIPDCVHDLTPPQPHKEEGRRLPWNEGGRTAARCSLASAAPSLAFTRYCNTSKLYCGRLQSFDCPPHLQRLPCCNSIACPLRNIRPPIDLPSVFHTPHTIDDGNIGQTLTPNPRVGRGQPRTALERRPPPCNPRQAQGPASQHSQDTQCTSDTHRSGEGWG